MTTTKQPPIRTVNGAAVAALGSGLIGIVGNVYLVLFYLVAKPWQQGSVGGGYGTINDWLAALQLVLLIPIVVWLGRLTRIEKWPRRWTGIALAASIAAVVLLAAPNRCAALCHTVRPDVGVHRAALLLGRGYQRRRKTSWRAIPHDGSPWASTDVGHAGGRRRLRGRHRNFSLAAGRLMGVGCRRAAWRARLAGISALGAAGGPRRGAGSHQTAGFLAQTRQSRQAASPQGERQRAELSKPPESVRISGNLVRPLKRAHSERSAGLRIPA
jgi:hypothetical protein